MLRVKVDEANRESKKGNLTRAVNHLTEARRLPRLALVNAMFLNALQCAGVEKEFYQRVDKMIKEDPSLAKNLPMDLVVPIANFLPVQILVEEFVFTMGQNESFNQPTKEFPGVFIPKDARSLELTTKSIRNVTIYFKKIRNAKNFREAERAYSEVEPNLARAKSNIQGETDYVLGVAIIFEGIDMLQDINKTRNALTHLLGAAKNK